MLTFMQLSENKKEIDYGIIQQELNLHESDIEDFIIDGKCCCSSELKQLDFCLTLIHFTVCGLWVSPARFEVRR